MTNDRAGAKSCAKAVPVGGVDTHAPRPEEIINHSREMLKRQDDDQLMKQLVAASVEVVLKAHRSASQKLDRSAKAERDRLVAAWGEKHAWRNFVAPSIARLADVIADFDRRAQAEAQATALSEIEIAPFEIGSDPCSVTIIKRGAL